MTLRILFLLLLAFSVLQAQTNFPAALAPPRLISAPEFGNPPRHQSQITVGTGPDLTVVAWADERAGRNTLFAARVTHDGTVLDPLGLPIHDDARPEAVVWNGQDFLIAGRIHIFGTEGSSTLFARLNKDGVVLEKTTRRIGRGGSLAAVSGSGTSARVLYFDNNYVSDAAFLFDGHGNLLREQPLSPPVGGDWTAASHSSGEFLILRSFGNRVIAQRLSGDGSWLSSLESNLPMGAHRAAVVGGKGDGYLLFTVGRGTDIHFLDKGGVWTGKKTTLLIGLFNGVDGPRHKPLFVEDRFLAAWFEPAADGGWDTYYGEISEDGTLMVRERVAGRSGQPWETQLVATSPGQRLLVTAFREQLVATGVDLTIQKITPQLSASSLLTTTSNEQSGVAVAAGEEGFGAVWMERSDANARLMFRTLSSRGDGSSEPIELARESCCRVNDYQHALWQFAIASNGRVFLIAWVQQGDLLARRYSSEQGWLDAEPFVLDGGVHDFKQQSVASNGKDFLATWFRGGEIRVRHLPAAGSMDGLATTISNTRWNYQPVVASDGKDYLVVWSEGQRVCQILCHFPPFTMLGSRVRSNGTVIDLSPLILESGKYREIPSVAWDGRHYVVVNNPGPYGMRVTSDGRILDRLPDGTGTPLRPQPTRPNSIGVLAPASDGVLLLTSDLGEPSRGHWNGLFIRAETPLSSVSAIPSHRIVDDAYGESVPVYVPIQSLSVAHRGGTYLFGFVRVADANIGRGFRVFTHLRGQPARPRGLRR